MGHGKIGDYQVPGPRVQGEIQRIGKVHAFRYHVVAAAPQLSQKQRGIIFGVLNHQHAKRGLHLLPQGRRLFVKNQPVQSQLAHSLDKLVEVNGFTHVTVRAQAVPLETILLFVGGS
jgi:hypothetical protein